MQQRALHRLIEHIWYGNSKINRLLAPFAVIYYLVFRVRTYILQRFCCWHAPIPVVIVGNLTVGGVGKTPLVAAIANYYTKKGLNVGIVSRGYGAKDCEFPHLVTKNDTATKVGDEPLLLTTLTASPVMIAPNRVQAVKELLKHYKLDLIISDDGLQHTALGRSTEIVVVDSKRGFGNGYVLPAGPLREPKSRLKTVDLIVCNGDYLGVINSPYYVMQYKLRSLKAIKTDKEIPIDILKNISFNAVVGIGNPQCFFASLKQLGLNDFKEMVFPDHHIYKESDFKIKGPLVMTEKDAVKCLSFAKDDWYSLGIDAIISDEFWGKLTKFINNPRKSSNL